MEILKSNFGKRIETIFRICYLCLAISTFNPFIYDSAVQPLFVKATLGLGAVLLLVRLLQYKDYINMPCVILMALFLASFGLTAVMNRQYGITGDLKWIVWTGLQFFALYLCDTNRKPEEYRKEFRIVSHLLIVYNLVSCVISLAMLVTSYSNIWETETGEFLISGFTWGRLWGFYTDPNYGAVVSVIVILLSVAFCMKKRNAWRILYIVSIIANVLYLIFSDSRTGELALFGSLSLFIIMLVIRKHKEKSAGFRAGMIALAVVCTAAVTFGGFSFVKQQYNRQLAPEFAKIFLKESKENKGNKDKKADQVKQNVGRKQDLQADISNGRIGLWKSGIEVWKTSPVWGSGYTTFIPYAEEHAPNTYAVNAGEWKYTSLHNAFMNTLVYQGTLGFVLLLLLAGKMIRYIWKPVFEADEKDYLDLSVMLCSVGAVVISMMFLLEGMYTNSPGSFILWTFSGYLVQYAFRIRKGKEEA